MPEAFICDGIRTAIGRYAGGLAKVRTDDLARGAAQGADEAASERRLVGGRRGGVRLRQPGRRGQPQRGAHGAAAGGPAGFGSGRDGQPAVRVGPERGRLCGAGDPRRRDRSRHRRRRRVDDARAAGHGQGAGGVPAQRADRGHHDRLALHQSADEEAVRRRRDAGDRGERRRGLSGRAQGPGRVRAALAAARRQGAGRGLLRRGDRAGDRAGRQGGSDHRRQGRAHPSRNHDGGLGQAEELRARSRHRHRGQCVGRQRRRRRDADRVGGRGEEIRPQADRAHHRHGVGRACRRASWASVRCRRPAS